ncbi:MAG: hypothetical protein IJU49_01855, partial [Lachnospiraceae bacterium]|nr:hypothetical protein [Lachnospiraceae bacterium]
MTTHSLSMRLLSVLLTLTLAFTLTGPAAGKSCFGTPVKAQEISEEENYTEDLPAEISDASW